MVRCDYQQKKNIKNGKTLASSQVNAKVPRNVYDRRLPSIESRYYICITELLIIRTWIIGADVSVTIAVTC